MIVIKILACELVILFFLSHKKTRLTCKTSPPGFLLIQYLNPQIKFRSSFRILRCIFRYSSIPLLEAFPQLIFVISEILHFQPHLHIIQTFLPAHFIHGRKLYFTTFFIFCRFYCTTHLFLPHFQMNLSLTVSVMFHTFSRSLFPVCSCAKYLDVFS